ncbi:hypothetical protein LCGC14_0594230 [marine sediment metagenome]|uniref:Uncharacterized protein n=1 Tax=marine sediment metagenome TaxID=412755 RepID=A0A0F9TYM5_9ZZZZ
MGGRSHAHAFDHSRMIGGPAAADGVIQVTWKTEDGIFSAYGTTAVGSITDTDTYAPGCQYTDVNLARVYVNEQTDITSAPSWVILGSHTS